MYKSQTQDNCSYLNIHVMSCDRFTHTDSDLGEIKKLIMNLIAAQLKSS